jgi:TonB family protein
LAGKVRLKLVVGTDGSVTGVTVVAGNPILANAAVRSVRHWRYPRTEVGGRAVEAETTVTISFLGPDVVTINFRP